MGFTGTFAEPFFTGTQTFSSEVPSPWHCALAGHPYLISMSADATEKWGVRYESQSVPLLRQQADNSDSPGEQSISPSLLWRRSMESWHHGAGQQRHDWKSSDPFRFWTSKNVNVWNPAQLTLLPATADLAPTSGIATNAVFGQVAGSLYYVLNGATGFRLASGDLSLGYPLDTRTALTGITGGFVCTSVASDGFNVWAAYGANGLLKTTTGGTAFSSYLTGTVTLIGYAKGRLLAADGAGLLYNPLPASSGAISALTPVMPQPSTGWQWTAIGDGPTCIYAAGASGDQSLIYAITINSAGTGLNVPVIAGAVPSGETVRSIYTYQGSVFIGTDKGVHMAAADSGNNLTVGGLIPTSGPVYDFEGQGSFVWFTWSNMDAASTGLGRISPEDFTATLIPAYAADLTQDFVSDDIKAHSNQGTVRTVSTWLGKRVFTVDGGGSRPGAFIETPKLSAEGSVDSGKISFGVGDPKTAVFVDVAHGSLIGVVETSITVDDTAATPLGVNRSQGSVSYSFAAGQPVGTTFSIVTTIARRWIVGQTSTTLESIPYGDGTQSPVLGRVTLRALPQPSRILEYTVPLMLEDVVQPSVGIARAVDVTGERAFLDSLLKTPQVFVYQEGVRAVRVSMVDNDFIAMKFSDDGKRLQGVYVAVLREVQE
jgi:hypothetical protein